MRRYLRIRRIALKYKELSEIKEILIKLSGNKKPLNLLYFKYKKVTAGRDIRRFLNYIRLYEVIFERSLNMLECPFDKKVTELLCKKGLGIKKTADCLYVSESTVERAFKRFVMYFYNNLNSSNRIIDSLSQIKKLWKKLAIGI